MAGKELKKSNGEAYTNLSFNFMGDKIIVSAARDLYNDIRNKFILLWQEADEEFVEEYKTNYDMDCVHKHALEQGNAVISSVLNAVVQEIVDDGFYNISESSFYEEYFAKYYNYQDFFDKVDEKYLKIVMTQEEEAEYRRLRKENRDRWVGGGFGFEGALKGAAKAGVLNAGAGILHGIANMAGNAMSSISASIDKDRLFKDPNTLEKLREGIRSSVLDGLQNAYIDFVFKNYNNDISFVKVNEAEEAKNIFNNLKCRDLDKATEIDLLKKVIALNPYNYDVYEYVLNKYSIQESYIDVIADYFGFDINSYKEEKIKKWFKEIKLDSEAQALQAKDDLKKLKQQIRYNEKSKEEKIIEQKLIDFDTHARTFNNVVFDTRDDAKNVKTKYDEINQICNQVDKNNLGSLLNTFSKLANIHEDSKLHKFIKDQINNNLQKIVEIALDGDINKAKLLKEEIDKEQLSDNDKSKCIALLDEKVAIWKKNDENARTVWDKVYDTKEEALRVRKSLTFNGTLYRTTEEVEKARKASFNGKVYKSELEIKKAKKRFLKKYSKKVNFIEWIYWILIMTSPILLVVMLLPKIIIIIKNKKNRNHLFEATESTVFSNFITIPDNDLTSAFEISNHEVTEDEYQKDVLGKNDYRNGPNFPKMCSWYQAIEYCNILSINEGLTPCYFIDKNNSNNQDESDEKKWSVIWNHEANGYRLPTVQEWIYAAKGGSKSKGFLYSGSDKLKEVAWYKQNSSCCYINPFFAFFHLFILDNPFVHPVMMKKPNELGLYDMSGNVDEWCWDYGFNDNEFNEIISSIETQKNYIGPSTGSTRCGMGGNYNEFKELCKIDVRSVRHFSCTNPSLGFRLVRSAK